MVKSG